MEPASLDLTLPEAAPELIQFRKYAWSASAFYLYTLVPGVDLDEVAVVLQGEWLEDGDDMPILKVAKPEADFSGKTLADVVAAHVATDKGIKRDKKWRGRGSKGDVDVYPEAFVVVTKTDWKEDRGLLFVYVMEGVKGRGGRLDKYFFKYEDGYILLSSVWLNDETMDGAKEAFDIDGKHDLDDEEEEEEEVTTDEEDDE
ncbi:uncharacterized protein F4812DRAFT_328069 [Daldinia caldariorum]|uniref:uncharacterized protein n=1 Tax=Daldinia caldariorum TaxID=326644 RepID=UPI002007E18B|nr:uncharacterized protein F4812DRAFT_328069 [Daldinia caldariorum]KAI1469390.1 hypothetical protein F4812DRAFT_328069 [Daldinia caldariorum]